MTKLNEFLQDITEVGELHTPGTPWLIGDVLIRELAHDEDVPPGWTLLGGTPRVAWQHTMEHGLGDERVYVAKLKRGA
jgi:hypothetical protein